jgi:hypothetical protein
MKWLVRLSGQLFGSVLLATVAVGFGGCSNSGTAIAPIAAATSTAIGGGPLTVAVKTAFLPASIPINGTSALPASL